jgi:cellulose synthase operon protein C
VSSTGQEHLEQTSRPASVAPPSGTTLLGPRRIIEPIDRRPERRLPGDPREPPAAIAALRARMRSAQIRGDTETEATTAARLTRHLLAIDAHLDEAVAAGRRAIALRPTDEDLRRIVAEVLRSLGEPGLAAAILRPVVDAACARASRDGASADQAVDGLLTLGDLLLRAGDVDGAIESFRYVTVVAPERPDGQERLAIARGIAPGAISSEIAARAYIGAAKKYQLAGDEARSLEALARAFEVEPKSPLAANVLADTLEEMSRFDAADAVRAEHARAINENLDAAAVVHAARREKARLRGDRGGIVATVLDELVELCHRTDPGPHREVLRVDAALEEVPELANARRRVYALLSVGGEALEGWRAVARAATTPEHRLEAWTEIIARDLTDESALASMREHARVSRDPVAIVDALIRGLRGPASAIDGSLLTARCAELAGWADEQLDDPALAAWAWQRLLAINPDDRRAKDELARLAPRMAVADQRLAEAERASDTHDRVAKADGLRREIRALFGRPEREAQILGAIEDLLEAAPEDTTAVGLLDRLARRAPGDEGRFALDLRERITVDPADRARVRLQRVEAALRRGDVEGAIAAAGSSTEPEVAPTLVALALRAGRALELGHALARFAPLTKERAIVLAAASRACRVAGRLDDARRFAEDAVREGPRDLRAIFELADLAAERPDIVSADVGGPALERALASIGPRGRWAIALAEIAEKTGEPPLAAAWSRRAWSLRPGDLEIAALWLTRAAALQDPEIIAEVVRTTSSLVASLAPLSAELAAALKMLFNDDARTGEIAARGLLSFGAARLAPIREAILSAPSVPPSLVLAVQERWLASGAAAADRPRVLLAIAETARAADEPSRAADAAGRMLLEGDADPADRNRARTILRELGTAMVDGDAELAVRQVIADIAAEEAIDTLNLAPRARVSPETEERLHVAADAHRILGRDLWDLADDRDAALRAWLNGARLLGGEGLERLEVDIAHFGGEEAARDALFELARREDVDGEPKSLAGRARFDAFRLRAWDRLVMQPPGWVEPLSLAREAAARASDPAALLPAFEILAQRHQRYDVLHDLYEITAGRTAGRFGMRAVHYRAARILDRLGRRDDALDHAVRAFSSVPSEGAMLVMLERLARGSRRADVAINALVEAADQADDADKKTTWLDRAAVIAENDALPAEERVDLLLRLFITAPSARTVEGLVAAVRAVVAADRTLAETWVQRLLRAHRKIENQIGWSQRVPVLVTIARLVAELEGFDTAIDMVAKAAGETPRSDLAPLRELSEELGKRDPEAARAWLDKHPTGGPIRPHLAWAAGDPDRAIELLAAVAPQADGFDLSDGEEAAPPEIAFLERWAPSATDKALVARAWERFGRHGPAAELAAAKALDEAGQTEEAARVLIEAWRARGQASPAVLREILTLAHAILPQASADAALVDMLIDDLQANEGGDAVGRVARWRQIAEMATGLVRSMRSSRVDASRPPTTSCGTRSAISPRRSAPTND